VSLSFGTLAGIVGGLLAGPCALPGTVPADLILRDGRIYTVDPAQPWASAVAVRGGRIVFVGSDRGVRRFRGPGTKVIDLGGRMAMPGVADCHVHILEAFQKAAGTCFLPPGHPLADYIPIIRACAPNQVGTNWVLGYGHSIFDLLKFMRKGGVPKEILDQAVPDRPAAFLEETSHSVWANSRALQALGFDAATPDPPGGVILHDPATGEPNGVLLDAAGEMAMDLALVPNPVLDRLNHEALLEGLAFANRHGITSLCDARCYWKRGYVEAWKRVRDEGRLTVHAVVGLWAYPYLDDRTQIPALAALYSNDPGSRLRFSQIKLYTDGEISHTTAALLQPYRKTLRLAGPQGLHYFDQIRLEHYLTRLGPKGFDFHIHAIGDAGVHDALDAIEAAEAAGAAGGSRHRITHVTLVSPSDVPRFAALDVTADFQMSDNSVFPDRFRKIFGPFLGGKRVRQEALRLRTLYDAGARVILSSDYDVGEISPFAGMQRALTRGPESLPSLAAAIRACTIEPAWVMRQEDRTGTLERGKLADIIVLDRDLFRIPPAQLGDTKVLLTLLEGETVWRAPGF